MYVYVRNRERLWTLVDSLSELYVLTGSHHSWLGTWEDWGQRLCELRGQKNGTTRPRSMFSKCSPSCKINIRKFSSPPPPLPPPSSCSQVWNQPSISVLVVEDKTQICVGSLWCLVSFVLNCIGADTYLMSASASYLKSSAAFLQLPAREEMGAARLFLFHHLRSWYCLPHPHSSLPLYHPLPVVSVRALTWE